jgi:hypothetical protein
MKRRRNRLRNALRKPMRAARFLLATSLGVGVEMAKKETECYEIGISNELVEYRRFSTTAADGVLRNQW